MAIINSILATVQFEVSRVMTLQRLSVAGVMALFPPLMLLILQRSGALLFAEFMISVLCGMICLLSLLLWATPNVNSELEGKTWTFVTSRPFGRWSILFGKFLIAFLWAFLVAWIALTLSMLAVGVSGFLAAMQQSDKVLIGMIGQIAGEGIAESVLERYLPVKIWLTLSILLGLASMVYAAIFSFLGVLMQRRAMVVAVGYFLLVEMMLAAVPAVIGKFAMSYHMFCILLQWLGWIVPEDEVSMQDFVNFYGMWHWGVHMSAIFVMTAIMLGSAAVVIKSREYITLEDSQV